MLQLRVVKGIGPRFVYILRSETDPSRHYVGVTEDFEERLHWHNEGPCGFTIDGRPWLPTLPEIGVGQGIRKAALWQFIGQLSGISEELCHRLWLVKAWTHISARSANRRQRDVKAQRSHQLSQ